MRAVIVLAILMFALSSNAAGSGTIVGTLTLEPGISGDLGNTVVLLYASYNDWNTFQPLLMFTSNGSGSMVSYMVNNIPAGTYYLDAWKDNDLNVLFSDGDYYGVYGTYAWPVIIPQPLLVTEGLTTTADLVMHVLGTPTPVRWESWGQIKAAYR